MIDLHDYGYTYAGVPPEGLLPARITRVYRDIYHAVCERGECRATVSGAYFNNARERADMPCVGDFVFMQYNHSGPSLITLRLPRQTTFSRADFLGHRVGHLKTNYEQVVAANFDYVFIMSSLNKDFNVSRINRYLIQARQSGGLPVVLLTKADLCEDARPQLAELSAGARGVDIIPLSSVTGAGLDRLADYMKPRKTAVFLGMSGVGKSTLVNALAGEEIMAVREIREIDARGRHTTTHRQLHMLPSGAMVIDTPGMRELGFWHASSAVESEYGDVEQLISRCRFSDCRHRTEPGCAVREALASGELDESRWQSYRKNMREAAFIERKAKKSELKGRG